MAATKPTTTDDTTGKKPGDQEQITGGTQSPNEARAAAGHPPLPNPADDPPQPYPSQAQLDEAKLARGRDAAPYVTRNAKAD